MKVIFLIFFTVFLIGCDDKPKKHPALLSDAEKIYYDFCVALYDVNICIENNRGNFEKRCISATNYFLKKSVAVHERILISPRSVNTPSGEKPILPGEHSVKNLMKSVAKDIEIYCKDSESRKTRRSGNVVDVDCLLRNNKFLIAGIEEMMDLDCSGALSGASLGKDRNVSGL